MKKSRIRKTSNDTIDAESIARYLMIMEDREAFVVPDNLRNLREIITAYGTVTGKIRTAKNNLIRAMDMIFPGLSNTVEIDQEIDQDTLDMLSRYIGPEDFPTADQEDVRKYVSRRTEHIRKIASDAPTNACTDKALRMEISSLIRILKVLMEEKERFENAMKSDFESENHVIRSIPGIGPITGAIILGKVCDINRFENAEKLVAFAGIDPVIKESGKQRSQRAISKRGDPTLRSALYQSALAAIRGNPAISEFYHRKGHWDKSSYSSSLHMRMYALLPRYSFGQSIFAPDPNFVTLFSIITSILSRRSRLPFITFTLLMYESIIYSCIYLFS